MGETADVAIIGGGAAGLAAAIFAAEGAPAPAPAASGSASASALAAPRVVVLDGAAKLGAKILVSGGGRCNVTHESVLPRDFNAASQHVVRNVLAAFDAAATVRWFASLGVELKREPTGKLFPVADSAKAVLNALLRRCDALGVQIMTSSRVSDVTAGEAFTIAHERGALAASRVIVCTGGRSLPRSGSDGGGWEILRRLGHTVTPTHAALVPLVLAPQMFHAQLAGVAHEAELSVFVGGRRVDGRAGSMLWTHFGVSGPVAMDASRHWTIAHESGQAPVVKCNLLPGESFESCEKWLIDAAAARPKASVLNHVAARLPERVAAAVLGHAGIAPATPAGQLPRDSRRALVHALTALVLPVVQQRGWNYAEVTAGGVPLGEVDYRTMESRRVPRLHLAGEVLDVDGRIGGFNFQWAWATGYLAGRAAASG